MRASSVEEKIIETLSSVSSHLTSAQVFEELRPALPAVNQSTVYRALERLVLRGQVSVSDMGTGAMVYELVRHEHHHHLVCEKCKKVSTLDDQQVTAFFNKVEAKNRFSVRTNHLVLFGLCEQCQKAEGSGQASVK
jgi:Fur family ferric uptake transcriptional regulator